MFGYENEKVSMVEDTIGRRTCYRYDGELLTEVEHPNHGTVHYTYTPEGCLEQATDQNGHTYVHNYYDMDGRVMRKTLSNGQEYIILYDDALRVNTFLTPSNGSRRKYHYNKDELLVKTVYTDGTAEVLGYDRGGDHSLFHLRLQPENTWQPYREDSNLYSPPNMDHGSIWLKVSLAR